MFDSLAQWPCWTSPASSSGCVSWPPGKCLRPLAPTSSKSWRTGTPGWTTPWCWTPSCRWQQRRRSRAAQVRRQTIARKLKVKELWAEGLFFFQLPESSDESSLASSPLRHRLPQSMKIVHEIMYKVEVLYVLCVLLMGRQRNQVRFHNLFFSPSGFKLECRYLPELSAPLLPVCCYCRSTRCWLSSGSSQASTTCLTSSSGGSTPLLTTWCTARMRTATVVRYEPLTQCCSCRLTWGI